MKQPIGMIPKEIYFPIYEMTPITLRSQLIKRLGFDSTTCSNFTRKRYITLDQFVTMQNFKDQFELMSSNTVGMPVDFDIEQIEKYNKGLVKFICGLTLEKKKNPAFNRMRRRLETEQEVQQKRINDYKRLIR